MIPLPCCVPANRTLLHGATLHLGESLALQCSDCATPCFDAAMRSSTALASTCATQIEGWLTKSHKGKPSDARRRFFVLKGFHISYYSDDKRKHLRGAT